MDVSGLVSEGVPSEIVMVQKEEDSWLNLHWIAVTLSNPKDKAMKHLG